MKRIDTANRGIDLLGAGKDGFRAAVPGVSDPTYVNATWFNAVQEAIVRMIEAAGLSPSEDYDQFKTALNTLFASAAQLANAADPTQGTNLLGHNGVTLRAALLAVAAQITSLQQSQAAGTLGYTTLALLNADLAHPVNTLAIVTNDATAANNTTYIKLGASGAGSWQVCTTSPQAVLRAYIDSMIGPNPFENGWAYALVDAAGRCAGGWRPDGTFEPTKVKLPAGAVAATMLDASTQGRLFGASDIGSQFAGLGAETGYAFAIVDSNNRMIFGIPSNGGAIQVVVQRALTADNAGISRNAPRVSTNYLVYTVTDGNGKQQIVSVRLSDGRKFALTSIGNNVSPALTAADKVLFSSDASGTFKDMFMPADGSSAAIGVLPLSDLDCWGDSLSSNTYETALAALLPGRTIRAQGISSQVSSEIMARQGGAPALLTVASNQIPASGPVDVPAISVALLTSKASPSATLSMTGTLAGIPGTLTKSGTVTYTFTRTAAGLVTACPANTAFIPDVAVTGRTSTPIIWAGTNDVIYAGTSAGLVANVNAGVAYLSSYVKRAIVIGPLNRSTQPSGSAEYNMVTQMETALASGAAANNYVFFNLRRYLIDHGLADAGITPTTQDTTDISNDIPPTSLRTDSTHLTAVGYQLAAQQLANIINNYGF